MENAGISKFRVGLPSLIGGALDEAGLNNHDQEWYETNANRRGLRYFEKFEPESLINDPSTNRGRGWDFNEYPTRYVPNWYWILTALF